jgi:nitrate/TMAO reductase-like tetraheme cytochrome c subunit/mono/diheme cytochrome c family protein
MLLPYVVLGVLTLLLLVSGAYAWEYTNSPGFCGTTCHTMPPEYAAYQVSPHARIACVDCHIGREFVGNQILRKAGDVRHIVAMTFQTYEYPIRVKTMRPARETCEKCHSPEKFSDDSLRVASHFRPDPANTPYDVYLVLKTGGGTKREGLGRGIHWHIVNKVYYLATDPEEQEIPFVRVITDAGAEVDYIDVEAGFDPATADLSRLQEMDCITCHNRITHRIYTPEESVDRAIALGQISRSIPDIRAKSTEVLRAEYASREEAEAGIAQLESYYEAEYSEYHKENLGSISDAVEKLQDIYAYSVFPEQKVDWNSHPTNVGHIDSPGCFRCHDGKHLSATQEAVRLECNLCHSVPVVAGKEDFVAQIEVSRGSEPASHLNPNWISLHNQAFNQTCSNCHTTGDPGGTSNESFCSNPACHGTVFTFAGFDAPALREILRSQLPTPEPTVPPPPVAVTPSFDANIQAIFEARCTACHGPNPSAGLSLLTYSDVMAGSATGPVIVPADSANSRLVQVQSEQHFANLTADELKLVIEWIEAGAPEQ